MQFNLTKSMQILELTPLVVSNMLTGISTDWTSQNEGPDTWSSFDIIGHLIHGEKTDWLPRTKIILERNESVTFTPFDRFAQFKESQGKSLDDLLTEFKKLRKQNLNELKALELSDTDMNLTALHPELGRVSLRNLLSAWVVHDLGHISQISRVMAKQLKSEVGPWPKYLTILNK